jgi:hypothetical protein
MQRKDKVRQRDVKEEITWRDKGLGKGVLKRKGEKEGQGKKK